MSDELKNTTEGTQKNSDVLAKCDVTQDKIDTLNNAFAPKLWLEVLPSQQGTILAAIIANIMTEGLNPNQQNVLGGFISLLGSLISYKSARDGLDTASSQTTLLGP